jgi:epoxyqueuosine reductase
MTAAELEGLAEELELDVVGAAPVSAYVDTERHIRERKDRGLFADMRFTMAQPEVSCHPEALLEGARTVVSAAYCYYAPEPALGKSEGRLARYTWHDGYAVLRERLDELGRRLGGEYRVLVDANQHVDREAAARAGVGFYGKNTMLITRRHGSWVVLGTLVTTAAVEASPPLELDCGRSLHPIRVRPARSTSPDWWIRRSASPTGLRPRRQYRRTTAPSSARRSTAVTSARTSAPGIAASRNGARVTPCPSARSPTCDSRTGSRVMTRR